MAKTILLADDSVTIQKVVELTFMDGDYDVVAVSDGTAALAQLPEVAPDLLIADVHMPGADGYEVCRRTKQSHPSIPVLLLVGTFEQFDAQQAAAAGADGHLKKPFDSQELLSQVEALIASTGEVDAPAAAPAYEASAADLPAAEMPTAEFPLVDFAPPQPIGDLEPPPLLDESHAELEDTRPTEARVLEDAGDVFELTEEGAPEAPEPEAVSEPEPPVPEATPAEFAETAPIDLEPLPLASAEAPVELEAPAVAEAEPAADVPAAATSAAAPPAAAPPEAAEEGAPVEHAAANGALSDDDVERIARRVAEMMGEKTLREVAWEVIPDLAEVIIKERIRELESQVE